MHPILAYHQRTKHSFHSVRSGGHSLDWSNEPSRFKRYLDLEPVPLPPFEPSGVSARRALMDAAAGDAGPGGPVDLEALSHLLFHGAGVARVLRGAMGEFPLRTFASAGALYPVEVYLVAGEVEGLEPGVYHYGARDHALVRLRDGDLRGNVGLAGHPAGAVTAVITGIPWRTAWKYTARGFRHLYWDAGMLVANLLAAAAAREVPARMVMGFVDSEVERLLGIDGRTEFPLCAVTLGPGRGASPRDVAAIDLAVEPVSARPRSDPVIEEARGAVALEDHDAVRSFRDAAVDRTPVEGEPVTVPPLPEAAWSDDALEDVVRRRGSTRALSPSPFPAAEYAGMAERALRPFPADRDGGLVHALVVASALEGVEPGAYAFDGGFRLLRRGTFRQQAGYMCLEQPLGADAAAVTFLVADLPPIVEAMGGRGYAAAQLEAAVAAGRLYLGAYAQCLGASGITFYDDEIRAFFGADQEPMMAVVMGPEGRRRSIRRCRDALERAPARRPA